MSKTKYTDESHPGVSFDLTTQEVADTIDWSLDRVRTHAIALGGHRKKWGDGYKRPASWRFPSKGLKSKAKAIASQMQENKRTRTKTPVT